MFGLCCLKEKFLGGADFLQFCLEKAAKHMCFYFLKKISKHSYSCVTIKSIKSVYMELLYLISPFENMEYVFCSYIRGPNLVREVL